MQRDSANHHSHARLEVLEPRPHSPANLCPHRALPTPTLRSPHAGGPISATCTEGWESRARALPWGCGAARAQGRGHRHCLQGQAGLGVGRGCLHGGGRAMIVILATDLAGGTGSVGAGRASTYQGVPAGSLRCASQEPSCGDKFQPGLTRTESRWTEAGKQMERRKFGHNLKAPKYLVRKTHTVGSCLSSKPACSQP